MHSHISTPVDNQPNTSAPAEAANGTRATLREQLDMKRGDVVLFCNLSEWSFTMVNQVLDGKRPNRRVEAALRAYVKQRRADEGTYRQIILQELGPNNGRLRGQPTVCSEPRTATPAQ